MLPCPDFLEVPFWLDVYFVSEEGTASLPVLLPFAASSPWTCEIENCRDCQLRDRVGAIACASE